MSKFQIGDKVSVVCNIDCEFDGVEIGDTGIVVDIDNNKMTEFPVALKINNHGEYAFKEEELELVVNDNTVTECPIGIVPKDIWLKKRKQEILDAIIRYTEAKILIPIEWDKELRELEDDEI